jgi:hypothetical protein
MTDKKSIETIKKEEGASEEKKAYRKARRALRYIGRAERKEENSLKSRSLTWKLA